MTLMMQFHILKEKEIPMNDVRINVGTIGLYLAIDLYGSDVILDNGDAYPHWMITEKGLI
jgi:hypothetical protein